MPFKTDFGRGTEYKQKKSKLGHPNAYGHTHKKQNIKFPKHSNNLSHTVFFKIIKYNVLYTFTCANSSKIFYIIGILLKCPG